MPKLSWSVCEDAFEGARIIGPRIRKLRERRGLTLRELSDRAGISKTTLLRIEQGEPIAERLLNRICDILQTIPPNLLVSADDWDRPWRVHRAAESPWRIAFRRDRAPAHYADFAVVDSAQERMRMGGLGFVTGFMQTQECSLLDGKLQAAVVELYGDQDRPGYRHSGEEFLVCLQGRLKFTIGRDTLILEPGDSITFASRYRHRYESDLPLNSPIPTKMLMVWMENTEEEDAIQADEECDPDEHLDLSKLNATAGSAS